MTGTAMVTTRRVEYPADGLTMVGHLALPAGSGRPRSPGVLLGPEGTGLNDFQRRRADVLAELGYLAFAFDIHGGRWFGDPEQMMARLGPLLADRARMRAIGHAGLDVLHSQARVDPGRVAAVGYGIGGTIGLELGREGVDLSAIAAVNAPLAPGQPGEAARIACPVWVGVGSEDPLVTATERDAFATEMQAAGVDWRLVVYGGALHAFHHPPVTPDGSLSDTDDHTQPVLDGVGYHPRHAQRAWRAIVDLLAECLAKSQ
ncbi:MAG: dienelactone hydrolase family protein [Nocardioidaceae bacterium]